MQSQQQAGNDDVVHAALHSRADADVAGDARPCSVLAAMERVGGSGGLDGGGGLSAARAHLPHRGSDARKDYRHALTGALGR
jgi:hypothetical protein